MAKVAGLAKGLGNSVQKLQYLPEAHNDFIFAVIGEELGFVGVAKYLDGVFVHISVSRPYLIGRASA